MGGAFGHPFARAPVRTPAGALRGGTDDLLRRRFRTARTSPIRRSHHVHTTSNTRTRPLDPSRLGPDEREESRTALGRRPALAFSAGISSLSCRAPRLAGSDAGPPGSTCCSRPSASCSSPRCSPDRPRAEHRHARPDARRRPLGAHARGGGRTRGPDDVCATGRPAVWRRSCSRRRSRSGPPSPRSRCCSSSSAWTGPRRHVAAAPEQFPAWVSGGSGSACRACSWSAASRPCSGSTAARDGACASLYPGRVASAADGPGVSARGPAAGAHRACRHRGPAAPELPGNSRYCPGFTGLALASVVPPSPALVAAVVLYRLTWARGGPLSDAFTAVGLVILVVAELQYALWPSVYSGLVTISDMMRLVAYTVLVAGTIADQRSDLRSRRSAYTALDRMRVNEAERATLEERSRLAREIHDGLAQHLWFAKLKFERLSEPPFGRRPAARRRGRRSPRCGHRRGSRGPRDDALEPRGGTCRSRTCCRASTISGAAPGCAWSSRSTGVPANLGPRVQVELLRIVTEALTNVRKHADATTVRVSAGRHRRATLLISVTDNGRGFPQEEAFDRDSGCRACASEHASSVAACWCTRRYSGGTTVELRAPVDAGGHDGPRAGDVSPGTRGPRAPVAVGDLTSDSEGFTARAGGRVEPGARGQRARHRRVCNRRGR